MKTIFTIYLLLFGAMTLQAQQLKPFKADNGKFGYKDENGKVIAQPKYDFASYTFDDGLAQIRNNGKIGFIDQRGKEIIPLQYKGAYRFSEGLCAVTSGEDKWMFIDKTNTKVLELPAYVYTTGFTAFSDEMIFSEGLAPVRIHLLPYEKSIHDFTNPENVKRITKELGISSSFTEADKKKLHDYLTPLTKQAIQDPYRYSYIDKSGTLIIDPFKGYHTAKQFSEGLAAVGNYAPGNTYLSSDAKYIFGFIDKTGKLVVPMKYEKSRPYREGLAAVMSNKVWGFVDKNGKEVVPPQLGWVNDFKSGYAIVAHGKIVPGQEFNPFDKDAVWGIIGKDGKAVVPITHFSVSMNEDGMVTTENGNLKTQVHISGYEEFNKGHIAIQNKQYQEAVRHLLLAAEKGHGGAMGNIGILYASGTGVEKSIEKGLEWMKKGAEHNDLHSMLNLGLHFAQNHPQNFNESFKWLKKASDHNYAQAMGHLAMLYATGQGTTQNSDEAKKWLDKGVAMRDAHCMFNYGVLYYQGVPGFTKDKDKAVQWMNKAKTAGHPQANAALQQISEAQK